MHNPLSTVFVGSVMSRDVVTVGPDETLPAIHERLRALDIHHLLVVEDGRLVGVISAHDVLRALRPLLEPPVAPRREPGLRRRAARMLMTAASATVRPEMPLDEAAACMLARGVSSLPVVSDAGEVLGILTSRDIVRVATVF